MAKDFISRIVGVPLENLPIDWNVFLQFANARIDEAVSIAELQSPQKRLLAANRFEQIIRLPFVPRIYRKLTPTEPFFSLSVRYP